MKTFNHLYDKMIEPSAVCEAIEDAAVGKKDRRCVQMALADIDGTAAKTIDAIRNNTWRAIPPRLYIINESSNHKTRTVYHPVWNCEQIVHYCIINQLKQILQPRVSGNTYGMLSMPLVRNAAGKLCAKPHGAHDAVKAVKRQVKSYGNKRFYVAELDIRKFYESVNHDTLMRILARWIRDKQFLDVIAYSIEGFVGLPLGSALSPWLAAFYLLDMDVYINQELKPDKYIRYVDNIWLFSTNKRQLRRKVDAITSWLKRERGLEFGRSRQLYRFEDARWYEKNGKRYRHGRAINVLGFIIHRDRTSIRKGILKRARRTAIHVGKKGRINSYDASRIVSGLSPLKHANAYGWYKRNYFAHVKISRCKAIVAHRQRIISRKKERSEHNE